MFSYLTAAALASPLLPPTISPPSVQAAPEIAQGASLQALNGYPIARQVLLSANEIWQPQDIRPLPGALDSVPVFNSNSPEAIRQPGILLSTFPAEGKLYPSAHLNYSFQGRFDVFAHHISKTAKPDTTPTLYNGILVYNPSLTQTIYLDVLQAASFLGTPDAPYVSLPAFVENPLGKFFSGPGGRLTDSMLRNARQTRLRRIFLPPKQSEMLMNLPIPVPRPAWAKRPWSSASQVLMPATMAQTRTVLNPRLLNAASSSNARSTMMKLSSNGPIYMAYMAMYAPISPNGQESFPSKSDWENLLVNGKLAEPRDRIPSPLDSPVSDSLFYYGRVAGVSRGSAWQGQVTDKPRNKKLSIPKPGEAFSYGLSTLQRGTFGTGQVQSAPMIVRYPDTAFLSHGNYGVHYQLSLPFHNSTSSPQKIALSIQTPIKQNLLQKGLRFLRTLPGQIFFRGTVRLRYEDNNGKPQVRYVHLLQRQGQQGVPLAILKLNAKEERLVNLDYLYPPDATPPQVLTIQTLADKPSIQHAAYGIQH
jgi:hypothetical protein